MDRCLRSCVLLCVAITLQSCYHFRVNSVGEPATDYKSKMVSAFFWGLVEESVVPDNCPSNALDEVRVTTNLGYSIVSVVTLGIWMPMNVEWRCAKEPAPVPDEQ